MWSVVDYTAGSALNAITSYCQPRGNQTQKSLIRPVTRCCQVFECSRVVRVANACAHLYILVRYVTLLSASLCMYVCVCACTRPIKSAFCGSATETKFSGCERKGKLKLIEGTSGFVKAFAGCRHLFTFIYACVFCFYIESWLKRQARHIFSFYRHFNSLFSINRKLCFVGLARLKYTLVSSL